MNPNVEYMTENQQKLEQLRLKIGEDHGFKGTRPQHFKNCVVISWKWFTRSKVDPVNHEKLNEYVAFTRGILDKYKLWDRKHPFCEFDLLLAKKGIYCHNGSHKTWAIQEYILENLPEWAEVKKKN